MYTYSYDEDDEDRQDRLLHIFGITVAATRSVRAGCGGCGAKFVVQFTTTTTIYISKYVEVDRTGRLAEIIHPGVAEKENVLKAQEENQSGKYYIYSYDGGNEDRQDRQDRQYRQPACTKAAVAAKAAAIVRARVEVKYGL